MDIKQRLSAFQEEYQRIQQDMQNPALAADASTMKKLGRREVELRSLLELIERCQLLEQRRNEHQELLQSTDAEIAELAQEELPEIEKNLAQCQQDVELAMIEKDPDDSKDVVLEIRAGAGGDEAGLFASDLFTMYSRFAESKGWKVDLVSQSVNEIGGFKEVVAEIHGENVFSLMKYERGVHRIQRIPTTEKSGRIHTSTATVAVLPIVEEKDFEIQPSDLRIDVYRSSGAGGQHVNTTDSAVRITHIPTGVVVSCQDERSQLKNRTKALRVLRSRLREHEEEERALKEKSERRSQIGTGSRSEKIRTYNVPQNRITDHRIKKSWHGVDLFFLGKIDEMLSDLQRADYELQLRRA